MTGDPTKPRQAYRYLLLMVVVACLFTSMKAENIKISSWRYRASTEVEWHPCRVPGIIQDYLIQVGKLPNPHERKNEELVQGIEDQDWLYRADIELPEALAIGVDRYILTFRGIDTYSTIYINDQEVGHTDNMFVGYDFDISAYLRRGHNQLEIKLHAPLKQAHPLYLRSGINYPADNDHADIHYSVFTRKAPYSYGWDWGMRLVTMGIWQDVSLRRFAGARISDLAVSTEIDWAGHGTSAKRARLELQLRTDRPQKGYYHIRLWDGAQLVGERLLPSDAPRTCQLEIARPKLWWPHGWGAPHLYTLETTLLGEDQRQVLDQDRREIGVRELKFVQTADTLGQSFSFEVNRQPIFIKGANYVPGENILTSRTDETFKRLFDDVLFAGMNMLRVWGGGVYEDERFYQEADRRGILLWQDFMFACTPYPADAAFLEQVRREAEYQVRRLRHHPSIALWCGNNEVEEGLRYWGWQKRYPAEQYARMWQDYDPLFRQLLPEVVRHLDASRAYIHSSPYSANWGRPESWLSSDVHYWGLWYGREPFEAIDDKPMRFASEYGFQSFPDIDALRQFACEEDMALESPVMRQHQKASTGNSLIKTYMERDYKVPQTFTDFVYVGQVLQARGMEHVMRTLRRQRPVCMGSLYWQLNDAWPSVSWSSIDYYQNYKAMHYSVRRAYAPLALCPYEEDGLLRLSLANDLLNPVRHARLETTVMTLEGKILQQEVKHLPTIKGNSTQVLLEQDVRAWKQANICIKYVLSSPQGEAEYRWYGAKTKDLELPLPERIDDRYHISYAPLSADHKQYSIRIQARCYLKDLFLSTSVMGARWSDNLFDMAAGEERQLILYLPEAPSGDLQLKVRCMNEIH